MKNSLFYVFLNELIRFYYIARDILVDKKFSVKKHILLILSTSIISKYDEKLKNGKLYYFADTDIRGWPSFSFCAHKLSQITNFDKFCGH